MNTRFPDLKVTTCHSYQIFQPFRYICTNRKGCGAGFGRHSKSINVKTHGCGRCGAPLEFWGKVNRDGTRANVTSKAAMNKFIAAKYPAFQAANPDLDPAALRAKILQEWHSKIDLGTTNAKKRGGVAGRRQQSKVASEDINSRSVLSDNHSNTPGRGKLASATI